MKVRDASTLEVGLLPTDTVLIRLEGIKSCAPGGESKDFAARCGILGQELSTWLVRQAPRRSTRPRPSLGLSPLLVVTA